MGRFLVASLLRAPDIALLRTFRLVGWLGASPLEVGRLLSKPLDPLGSNAPTTRHNPHHGLEWHQLRTQGVLLPGWPLVPRGLLKLITTITIITIIIISRKSLR